MLPGLSKPQTSKKASVIAEQECEKFSTPNQGRGRRGRGVGVLTTQCLCALGANILSQKSMTISLALSGFACACKSCGVVWLGEGQITIATNEFQPDSLQFTLVESHVLLPVMCLHSPFLRIVVTDKTFEKVPSM